MITDDWKDLAGRTYGTIYIDPPWQTQSRHGHRGNPELHYETMPLDAIRALPIGELAARNTLIWLWTTFFYHRAAEDLLVHWGFKLRCELIWDKIIIGTGNNVRWRHEYLLVGARGAPKWRRRDIPSVIQIKKSRRHSEKPAEFRELIESTSPAPRIEVFGRHDTQGWDVLGNQVGSRLVVQCEVCGDHFSASRITAKTCSDTCRKAKSRCHTNGAQNGRSGRRRRDSKKAAIKRRK